MHSLHPNKWLFGYVKREVMGRLWERARSVLRLGLKLGLVRVRVGMVESEYFCVEMGWKLEGDFLSVQS